MNNKLSIITLTCLLVISIFSPTYASETVRIAIIQDTSSLSLKIKGFFQIRDLEKHKIIYHAKSIETTVTTYKSGIVIGGIKPASDKLLIESDDPEAFLINGKSFRGNIQLIKKSNNKLLVINCIELEDYIKGILYHESSHYWPMEALKAQAIISRTYALYQMQENRRKDFDLTSDIYSQVYGGEASERFRTNKAVDETQGKALFFKGKIIPAYFHATCGGHTEDAALLWNIDLAPLKGVVCPYCKESPHFNWHYDFGLKDIEKKLSAKGFKLKNITNLGIEGKDASGRITNLIINSEQGETKVSAKDFRETIGPNLIRSTNFSVAIEGKDAVFEGIGWGHGVGLCQWGAYFMAKDGKSAEEILKYYYPGTNVKTF
ncbi:MAG: SpoIID/LytB domain-containing protein [Candidatus Omnitrophota bacterium]|nr:SpoIID/LytB domain-containing protein [Candidatus Omnitrophota bacterium]